MVNRFVCRTIISLIALTGSPIWLRGVPQAVAGEQVSFPSQSDDVVAGARGRGASLSAVAPVHDTKLRACVVVARVEGHWPRMSNVHLTSGVRQILRHWMTERNAGTLVANQSIIDAPTCAPAEFSITVATRVVLLPYGRHSIELEVRDAHGLVTGKYTGRPSRATTRILVSPVCIDNPPCPAWVSWNAGVLSTLERGLLETLNRFSDMEKTNARRQS